MRQSESMGTRVDAKVPDKRLHQSQRRLHPALSIACFFAAALLASACAAPLNPAPSTAKLPVEVEQALGWLPTNCETLLVADVPFILRDDDPERQPPRPPESMHDMLLGELQGQATGAALGATEAVGSILDGARVRFAIEGARNFRVPKSLGEFLFDGASVVRFEPDSLAAVDAYVADCVAHAVDRTLVRGRDVVTTRRKVESDEWTFHVVRLAPDTVIGATDASFLDEVLARVDEHSPFQLPPVLREWTRFDSQALVWASHRDSVLGEASPGLALAYFVEESAQPDRLLFSIRLAGNADRVSRALSSLQSEFGKHATPLAHPLPDGEADFAIDLTDRMEAGDSLWMLLALVGHIVQL